MEKKKIFLKVISKGYLSKPNITGNGGENRGGGRELSYKKASGMLAWKSGRGSRFIWLLNTT